MASRPRKHPENHPLKKDAGRATTMKNTNRRLEKAKRLLKGEGFIKGLIAKINRLSLKKKGK